MKFKLCSWTFNKRVVRRATGGVLLSLLLPVAASGADSPPEIGARFIIRAPIFEVNLPPETLLECESAIRGELAALGRAHFSFLQWASRVEPVAAPPRAAAVLQLTLTNQPLAWGQQISLRYEAWRGTNTVDLTGLEEVVLYKATEAKPTHKPRQLTNDILRVVRDQFNNQDFRALLHENLLATIPLTRTVQVHAPFKRCILPIRWEELRASDESVILVSFQAQPPAESVRPVTLKLKPRDTGPQEPWRGQVGCLVLEFHYPPIDLLGEGTWDEAIPRSFQEKVQGTLSVFMTKYRKDHLIGTSGLLATEP